MVNQDSGFEIRAGCALFGEASSHSCSSGLGFVSNGRLCGWLVVTRLSQLGLSNLFETSDLSISVVENVVLKQFGR